MNWSIAIMKVIMQSPCILILMRSIALQEIGVRIAIYQHIGRKFKRLGIEKLDKEMLENLVTWQYNGSSTTIKEFKELDKESRIEVIEYIKDFLVYEKLSVAAVELARTDITRKKHGAAKRREKLSVAAVEHARTDITRKFLLVHAGLGNFSPDKDMEDYSLHDLVWKRADYNVQYFKDVYVITGHTPTQTIKENPKPGFIYRNNNHIAIDCGAHYPGGRLAAICLETMEEFYTGTSC